MVWKVRCWWICIKLSSVTTQKTVILSYCHNLKSHKAAEIVSCLLTTTKSGLLISATHSFHDTEHSFCMWWLWNQKIQCFHDAQEVFNMATSISKLTHSFQISLYTFHSPPTNTHYLAWPSHPSWCLTADSETTNVSFFYKSLCAFDIRKSQFL